METSGANMIPIPGFSRYTLSPDGRIFDSIKSRFISIHRLSRKRNYSRVVLDKKPFMLHRVILCAITSKPLNYPMEVLHLDNNGFNNEPNNLRWGTHAENMRMDRGNNHSFKGDKNKNSKLKIEDVLRIRSAYRNRKNMFWGRKKFAEEFGMCDVQINRIATSKTGGWNHVN